MAKEFVKGVTVGEATAEENTQPAVSTVETNEEETKQVILSLIHISEPTRRS